MKSSVIMKNLFLVIIGFFFLNISFGQEIKMGINLLGYQFEQNEERISWKELINKTEKNIDANSLIKKAKSQNTISSILSYSGGLLIGIPIGQSITDRDPNWILAYIGGGIVMIAIPIAINATKNASKGIELYNSSLKPKISYIQPEFKIVANGNGIGLSMNF